MFIGYKEWEEQYFKDILIPDEISICCDDEYAWQQHPEFNWVYNRLTVCETQNIPCGPHGVTPTFAPIFSKPMMNLFGKQEGSKKISHWDNTKYIPGHYWMQILNGTHLSTDFVVDDGKAVWSYPLEMHSDEKGNITKYVSVYNEYPEIIEKMVLWILKHLKGYTGVVNLQSIGNKIIDCRLRMTSQFVDLYGKTWLDDLVTLYNKNTWQEFRQTCDGCSLVLRTCDYGHYTVKEDALHELINSNNELYSAQVTLTDGMPLRDNGSTYKLAVINGHDVTEVENALSTLKDLIILTPKDC